jgi:hypothetical protein
MVVPSRIPPPYKPLELCGFPGLTAALHNNGRLHKNLLILFRKRRS